MREGLVPKKDKKCQVPKPLPFTLKRVRQWFLRYDTKSIRNERKTSMRPRALFELSP